MPFVAAGALCIGGHTVNNPNLYQKTPLVKAAAVVPRWLSERDLANYLGLSERTLQGWRLRNIGPPWRRMGGSAVRYDLTVVDQWAAQQPGGGVQR